MRFAPGETFRHLEIVEEIGHGAFATVFLARDTLVERTVALKRVRVDLTAAGEMSRKLILREARLAGCLSSPHIVTVHHLYDLGQNGLVIEMEHIKGITLDAALCGEPQLPLGEALRILRGVLAGLHVAHENDIVHRDVKPGNVLLGEDGAIKLTDFGLSLKVAERSLSLASIEGVVGTPYYVAPEVIQGKRATAAGDIWGLGVLAFRMLCGVLPFRGESLPELFEQIQYAPPTCLNNEVPAGVKEVVRSCLAKAPEDRPRSCAHILARLEDVSPATSLIA